jgi:hypothetical protein
VTVVAFVPSPSVHLEMNYIPLLMPGVNFACRRKLDRALKVKAVILLTTYLVRASQDLTDKYLHSYLIQIISVSIPNQIRNSLSFLFGNHF